MMESLLGRLKTEQQQKNYKKKTTTHVQLVKIISSNLILLFT